VQPCCRINRRVGLGRPHYQCLGSGILEVRRPVFRRIHHNICYVRKSPYPTVLLTSLLISCRLHFGTRESVCSIAEDEEAPLALVLCWSIPNGKSCVSRSIRARVAIHHRGVKDLSCSFDVTIDSSLVQMVMLGDRVPHRQRHASPIWDAYSSNLKDTASSQVHDYDGLVWFRPRGRHMSC
jgi:hypothetical protein